MNRSLLVAAFASIACTTAAQSPDLTALLSRPILDAKTTLAEVQDYTEKRVPKMPKVETAAEWQSFADKTRAAVLDNIVFRGETARAWRDAKTQVEWLDTIPGGPGYHIKKLRYEALPGLWIPAILYEPDKVSGKIPVHLAVNGHEPLGKAAAYKQLRCINLAKRGVACLNLEWLYFGQLRSDDFAHYNMNQLDLCGVSGLAPFYLEMSRALDILLALPYADPKRVAVSGLSGGGWQTIFISSLDTRVTFCNPVAGYSSFRTRARFPSDLGDSEQTPNDLATVADYAHLTAMLAGRGALLTYNIKDDCCFASDHALPPLEEAAAPMFALLGESSRLRTHVNHDPGTHNFELDNRQAFYAALGAEFFPGDPNFSAKEIASEAEVKTAQQLDVPLPSANAGFNILARKVSESLPHEFKRTTEAARADLADLVKYQPTASLVAEKVGAEVRGDLQATYWKLRINNTWTVPAVEITQGSPSTTTLIFADGGRKTLAAQAETLLAAGSRIIAIDPFYFGESRIAQRDFLYALLVAAVGDRPLGIQASQVVALARWATAQFKTSSVAIHGVGPRNSTIALIAGALEVPVIDNVRLSEPLTSLRQVIDDNTPVSQMPELFCFGLLKSFDIPQLKGLVGAKRMR